MGKPRNLIVVPRPPATHRGPAVDSLVRAPILPLGEDVRPSSLRDLPRRQSRARWPWVTTEKPHRPNRARLGPAFEPQLRAISSRGHPPRLGRPAPLPVSPGSAVSSSPHRRPVHRDPKPPSVSPRWPEPRPRPPRPHSPPAAPARPRRRRLGPATSPTPRGPARTARAGPGSHPGQGEVGHELLEGPRLLGLPLCVQRDLLTELPRVGAARAGRGGHGARPALAG